MKRDTFRLPRNAQSRHPALTLRTPAQGMNMTERLHNATALLPALAAGLLLAGCSTARPPAPPAVSTADEALVARFRPCVAPTGVPSPLPVLPAGEEQRFNGGVLALSGSGSVADGYNHMLWLDTARSRGVIVQTGGIAGRKTVFGPFDLAAGCRG